MENLEHVLTLWEKDSKIDRAEPAQEIVQIPLLHAKYLNILSQHRNAVKACSWEIATLKRVKWEFYTGKMSKEELDKRHWEPFKFVLKSDISLYLEGDTDLIELYKKLSYHQEVVEVCIAIMKELSNRTFQLREYMMHERFLQGGR